MTREKFSKLKRLFFFYLKRDFVEYANKKGAII